MTVVNLKEHIIAASAVIIIFICIQDLFLKPKNLLRSVSTQRTTSAPLMISRHAPVIYTYFTKNKSRQYQKDDIEQEDMRNTWVTKWTQAGWKPTILTEEDARKHPMFEEYQKDLDKLNIEHYDHICFHRWMAMSIVGGGFMADYDTIPLDINSVIGHVLPNEGKFTIYDFTYHPVPGLLSGDRFQWESALQGIMKYVPQHAGEFFNDMRALQQLVKDEPNFAVRDVKVASDVYSAGKGKVDCTAYEGMYAIHFSHKTQTEAVKKGLLPPLPKEAKSRAWHIRRFHQDWLYQFVNGN